jgi:hypothetical protein
VNEPIIFPSGRLLGRVRTRVTAAPAKCRVELEPALDADLAAARRRILCWPTALSKAVRCLEAFRTEFDVLFVYLPDRWEAAFFGHDDDFDLHDYLKAFAAIRGMPIQIVREGRALLFMSSERDVAYRPRNLCQGWRHSEVG